jgi:hypothetical protein
MQVVAATQSVRSGLQISSSAPLQRCWLGLQAGALHAPESALQSAFVAQGVIVIHPVSGPAHACKSGPLHRICPATQGGGVQTPW